MVTIDAGRGRVRPPAGRETSPRTWAAWSPWPARALIGAGLAMIPWLFVLAVRLPSTARAQHWPAAWLGLDTMEALGLVSSELTIRRSAAGACSPRPR